MRSIALLTLAALRLASSAPTADGSTLERRQILNSLAGMMLTKYKVSKTEEIPSKFPKEKGAKRVRITLGPFDVEPANVKHAQGPGKMDPNSQQITGLADGIPTDATYLSTESKMTYADGTEADIINGYYNHHFIIADASKSIPTMASLTGSSKVIACADGKNAGMPIDPFMGASESNRDLYFVTPENAFNGGYYVAKGDTIMISAEVVNYTNDTKKLYSVSEVEYIPGRPKGTMDVQLQVMDVGTCMPPMPGMGGMSGMVMPPPNQKKFSMDSKEVIIQKDGYILYRRGHMHDGGESVLMKVNGKTICDSAATYGGKTQTMQGGVGGNGEKWDTISNMKACREVVPVMKGDKLTIEAKFDMEKHPARQENQGEGTGEQMGLMTFMFASKI